MEDKEAQLAGKGSAALGVGAASAVDWTNDALTKTTMQTEYLAQKTNIHRL